MRARRRGQERPRAEERGKEPDFRAETKGLSPGVRGAGCEGADRGLGFEGSARLAAGSSGMNRDKIELLVGGAAAHFLLVVARCRRLDRKERL